MERRKLRSKPDGDGGGGRPKGKFGGVKNQRPAEKFVSKKQAELQTRKEKREIGIKASYKKLLRKEQPRRGPLPSSDSIETKPQTETPSSTTDSAPQSNRIFKGGRQEGRRSGPGGPRRQNEAPGKPTAFKKAKNIFEQKRLERERKEAERKRRNQEREQAVLNRKKKRLEKFKVLSQKTPKGQPVMKGRIQLLLKKIQSSMS